MSGLLDLLQSDDPAVKQGILQFGLGLLSSKGNFGNALGNAGQQGLAGALQYGDRQRANKRAGLQDQLTQGQVQQMQRQQDLQALPGQFMQPAMKPATMDNRDVGQPGEQAVNPASFDTQGYLTALQGKDPMAALQFQQAMAKPLSKFSSKQEYDQNGRAYLTDEQGNVKYLQGPNGPISAREKAEFVNGVAVNPYAVKPGTVGPANPNQPFNLGADGKPIANKAYQDYVLNNSRAGASSTNVSYGAPIAGVDESGKSVFFQPDKGGGRPAIVAGVRPPKDPNADKPLTESQGNATSFAARMRDASAVLVPLEEKGIGSGDAAVMAANSNLTNWASNPEARQYAQGARNWVSANLRKESGAAIPDSEMAAELKKYFPQPGEDAATRKQKAQARAVAEEGMLVQAGPGAKQVPGILSRGGSKAAKPTDIHSQADAILRGE
jgi:hypothetical protein